MLSKRRQSQTDKTRLTTVQTRTEGTAKAAAPQRNGKIREELEKQREEAMDVNVTIQRDIAKGFSEKCHATITDQMDSDLGALDRVTKGARGVRRAAQMPLRRKYSTRTPHYRIFVLK
jgi:hypothetical protein